MRMVKQNIRVDFVKFVPDVLHICVRKNLCLFGNFTPSKDENIAVLLTILNYSRIIIGSI